MTRVRGIRCSCSLPALLSQAPIRASFSKGGCTLSYANHRSNSDGRPSRAGASLFLLRPGPSKGQRPTGSSRRREGSSWQPSKSTVAPAPIAWPVLKRSRAVLKMPLVGCAGFWHRVCPSVERTLLSIRISIGSAMTLSSGHSSNRCQRGNGKGKGSAVTFPQVKVAMSQRKRRTDGLAPRSGA